MFSSYNLMKVYFFKNYPQGMPEISQPIATGRIAEIYAWEEGQVLKLFRSEFPRDWVDYEARVTAAAHAAGAPAPAVLGKIETGGRYGILFERILGPSMLAALGRNPLLISRMGRLLAEIHAAMHAQTAEGLPAQAARLIHAIQAANELSEIQRAAVLKALETRPSGNSLCHMDLHPDNVIMTSSGPCVIDWMTACTGNRWADVARTVLMLSIGDAPPGFPFPWLVVFVRDWLRRSYINRYLSLCPDPTGELRAWIPILAAARLVEKIPNEERKLIAIVNTAFGN
jgi:hypothetical protein